MEKELQGLLPLIDVVERAAYLQAYLEGDEEKLKELEEMPGVEKMRDDLEARI